VTFQYGLILPILFPLAVLGFINLLITEKICFAYFYQKPPVFGNVMLNGALQSLGRAPFLMLIFGYWQLGNRQIFFNESDKIDKENDIYYNPLHPLIDT
jgi:hypothetical protein